MPADMNLNTSTFSVTSDASAVTLPPVASRLAELTTFRVGGTFDELFRVNSEEEFIQAISYADDARRPLLVIGGGSNILADDGHFAGVLVQDARAELSVVEGAPEGRVYVQVSAGTVWDDFVAWTVEHNLGGVELLSGIPGSVGACPVQNIGAYGAEVKSAILSVRMWDRVSGQVIECPGEEMGFAYRDSMIKRSTRQLGALGDLQGPTGRWVVLSVTFNLSTQGLSEPIRYGELARVLEIPESLAVSGSARVPVALARESVLALRRGKGMVLSVEDHDSWSAGSFFMNPVVSRELAERLPLDAPRFPAGGEDSVEMVKTSAAWLITHAGFEKGFRVRPDAPASLSTKHSLALTNRGAARCADVVELARAVQAGVQQAFGIGLFPEPVPVGFVWEEYFQK